MRKFMVLTLVTATVTLSAQTVAVEPATPAGRVIRSLTDTASDDVRTHLHNFYAPSGYRIAWTRDARPTAQAQALITLFESAGAKGLRPRDYDTGLWSERVASLRSGRSLAEFDVAMTSTLMRYASDLGTGRVDPHKVDFDLDVDAKQIYLPALAATISQSADAAAAIAAIEPQHDDYRRLIAALAKYRRIAAESADDAPLPVIAKLSPNDTYDALPQLATILRRNGDLAVDAIVEGNVYSGAVVDAVKHFQSRHGLDADGKISKRTFAALNTPAELRVRQIEWALERWRWTPAIASPAIVVNIPEFRLRAVGAGSSLTMRVVVGKATSNETPVFEGDMRHVVFRPFWSVPPRIQRNEIVPKVENDRTWLARNNYEIVDASGRTHELTDETLARLRTNSLMVRQKPGTSNALGLVKFMFPNDNNVYLHSTPQQSLFGRTRRDLSHGCIRVEDPVALAEWTLIAKGWTREKVRAAMSGQRDDVYVALDRPIPVLILYATAVAGEDGAVHFYEDIYGHDVTLAAALDTRVPRPGEAKVLVAQAAPRQTAIR